MCPSLQMLYCLNACFCSIWTLYITLSLFLLNCLFSYPIGDCICKKNILIWCSCFSIAQIMLESSSTPREKWKVLRSLVPLVKSALISGQELLVLPMPLSRDRSVTDWSFMAVHFDYLSEYCWSSKYIKNKFEDFCSWYFVFPPLCTTFNYFGSSLKMHNPWPIVSCFNLLNTEKINY